MTPTKKADQWCLGVCVCAGVSYSANAAPLARWEVEAAASDHSLDLIVVRSVEWWGSAQQHVCHDTSAPDVALLAVAPLKDLRANVVRRTDDAIHLPGWGDAGGQTEVDQLDVGPCIWGRQNPVLELAPGFLGWITIEKAIRCVSKL